MMMSCHGEPLHITGPPCGEPPVTGGFSSQRAGAYLLISKENLEKHELFFFFFFWFRYQLGAVRQQAVT